VEIVAPEQVAITARSSCGWKDGDTGGPAQTEGTTGRKRKTGLTRTGLLMEGVESSPNISEIRSFSDLSCGLPS
jgi:hypothetical protein